MVGEVTMGKMKKIMIIMMMILCSSLVIGAIEYSYDTSHFGNTKFFQGTSGSASLSADNRTYCQGFKATETGTITQISLYTINTDCELNYCLSDTLSYPNDECYGSGGSVQDIPLQQPLNVSVNTIAGDYYYICVQANEDYGGSNCYVPYYFGFTGFSEEKLNYFGVTTNINDLNGVDTTQSLNLEAYTDYISGGAYVGWATNNRALREISYCYGEDNCYLFNPSIAGTFTNCNPPTHDFVGQVFKYAHETKVINNVTLLLTQGFANSPTDKFQIELYEWDMATNTTGASLYNSSQINFSVFSGYINWTFITHTFNESIQLTEDEDYIIGARCVVGCGGALNDRIFFFRYIVPSSIGDEWFGKGFQDKEGFFYIENVGGVKYAEDGFFLFGMGGGLQPCNDGIDNDLDGFIDLDDPSCVNSSYTSEFPVDVPQCNDGIDNDLDGFTDLDDPSCVNPSDTSEFPKDSSLQVEDDCFVEENCIMYDSIPYNDDPSLHGWYGDLIESTADYFYRGGYSLYLDGYDEDTDTVYLLQAKKNITNPNNYNNVEGTVVLSFVDDISISYDYGDFYIYFLDYSEQIVSSLKINFSDFDTGTYSLVGDVYASNGSGYVYADTIYLSNTNDYLLWIYFDFDQLNNEYSFEIDDYEEGTKSSVTYDMYSTNNIYMVDFLHQIPTTDVEILLQVVELIGSDGVETICEDPQLPYYLYEKFNGFFDRCGWVNSHEIYANGELYLTKQIPYYFAQKLMFGTIEDEDTRYVTLDFDLNIVNITTGDTITFRLYDEDSSNIFTVYFRDNGEDLWYDEDGTGKVAKSGIPLGQYFSYAFVLDLRDDTYDIYFNGTLVKSSAGFTDAFLNVENINSIKFSSNKAEYYVDELRVYSSDSEGKEQLPDTDLDIVVVDETVTMCGLFHTITPPCTVDTDCGTGDCLPNGKCNTFDMTYCDENGYVRASKCVIAGVTSCILEETTNIILDNFLLFLVLIIIIMVLAYIVYAFK